MNNVESLIIALFVRGILYGVYLVTLAHCLRWLLYVDEGWKLRNKVNWLTVTVPIVVFVLTTADLGIALQINLANAQGGHEPPSQLLIAASSFVEVSANLIVDALLIYRCWIIYSKSRAIVYLPALLWLGTLALFILITYLSIGGAVNPGTLPLRNVFFVAYCSCNIGITIYGTTAIICRIKSLAGPRLSFTSRILAESGVLYTISTVISLMATVFGLNTLLLSLACALNSCLAGIAFNIIQIRVGQRRAEEHAVNLSGPRSGLQFHLSHISTGDIGSSSEKETHETKSMRNNSQALAYSAP